MKDVVATVPWFQLDKRTYPFPCGYIKYDDLTSPPFFSKEGSSGIVKIFRASIGGLPEEHFSGFLSALRASELPGGPLKTDLTVVQEISLILSQEKCASATVVFGLITRVMQEYFRLCADDINDGISDGQTFCEDNKFSFECDKKTFSEPGFRFKVLAARQTLTTQPFFSKKAGRVALSSLAKDYKMSAVEQKRLRQELESSSLPIETTALDIAIAQFNKRCFKDKGVKKELRRLGVVVKNGMLVDLRGPLN